MPVIEFTSNLITLVGLALIILVVAIKNARTKTNRWFLAFSIAVFLYIAASFGAEFANNLQGNALFWTRTALMFANFIPLFFLLFSWAFTGKKPKWTGAIPVLSIVSIALAVAAYFPEAIGSVQRHKYGTLLDKTGPLLWLTLINFAIVFVIALRELSLHARAADHSVKLQIRLISYGIGAAVIINMITQIILPEFHVAELGNLVGTPSLILMVGAVGYAIVRHRMFDIRAVILRSIGFASTIAVLTLCYSLLILGGGKLLFPKLNLSAWQDVYFVGASVLLTLIIRPLIEQVGKLTDKVFYRDRYDGQELINRIGRVLASEIDLTVLTTKVRVLLAKQLRVNQVDIVVLDNNEIYLEAAQVFTDILPQLASELAALGESTIITDELAETEQKQTLRKYGIGVFTVLKTRNEKIGYLLLAEKNSGAVFGSNDTRLIEIVADELAIAIQNSRDYAQIEEFNKTLQSKVEEATKQLHTANDKLKTADAVKDDFISMASHQLLTPMAVVGGYLELITKLYSGKLDEKLTHLLNSALDRTVFMKSMVDDLLNVSRMTAGKFQLELSTTDMNDLVKIEVEQLQAEASDKAVKMVYHEPAVPAPAIEADSQKVRQVVMNLITNALSYTPGGTVNVYLEADENDVIFRVVDNGIGVPEDQQVKLFHKFFRADNAKHQRPTGTGIGLYLVKRIIEDHGGSIIFESTANKGSTFGFKLPILGKAQIDTTLEQ